MNVAVRSKKSRHVMSTVAAHEYRRCNGASDDLSSQSFVKHHSSAIAEKTDIIAGLGQSMTMLQGHNFIAGHDGQYPAFLGDGYRGIRQGHGSAPWSLIGVTVQTKLLSSGRGYDRLRYPPVCV